MTEFDVIIIGGGIAGASLGAEIASKLKSLIVEAEDQCSYHSTGRSAAFYLESYGGSDVAKLTSASYDFLDSPPKDFAESGFLRVRGDLHITRDVVPELAPSVKSRVVEREELENSRPRDQNPMAAGTARTRLRRHRCCKASFCVSAPISPKRRRDCAQHAGRWRKANVGPLGGPVRRWEQFHFKDSRQCCRGLGRRNCTNCRC